MLAESVIQSPQLWCAGFDPTAAGGLAERCDQRGFPALHDREVRGVCDSPGLHGGSGTGSPGALPIANGTWSGNACSSGLAPCR